MFAGNSKVYEILDTNAEKRKSTNIKCGMPCFFCNPKTYCIIDASGYGQYTPEALSKTLRGDIPLPVVSAKRWGK